MNRSLVLLFALLAALAGCNKSQEYSGFSGGLLNWDSGRLTTAKAQRALDKWIGNAGEVTVIGIQELPQENAAKVDISFSNIKTKSEILGERNYSGPGFATFSRYNDGRWFLVGVSTSQGFDSVWWSGISVEAR
ncbi:hypothetical protein [Trichothermofontia sp.]